MNIRARSASLMVAGLVAVSLGLAAPAGAAVTTYNDGADATGSLTDILTVRVAHGTTLALVKITFPDLRKRSEAGPSGISIYLDTRPGRRGPEYRLGTGLQNGTDYQLMRMRDWKPVGGVLSCNYDLNLQFGKDRLVFKTTRGCIGTPSDLRVGARMVDHFDSSHPIVDWMKKPRQWTTWVASS